jgi:CheY-like chemotaxis protein
LSDQPIILLAEDNEDDIVLIQYAFRKANILAPLMIARDGEEAVCYLSNAGCFSDTTQFPIPALFIMDLKLPIRDGFEVLRWIQTQPHLKNLPVIVLTQSDRIKDANLAYQLGAHSFLVKGTDFKDTATFAGSVSYYLENANRSKLNLPPAWPAKENMAAHSGLPIYPQPPEGPQPPI